MNANLNLILFFGANLRDSTLKSFMNGIVGVCLTWFDCITNFFWIFANDAFLAVTVEQIEPYLPSEIVFFFFLRRADNVQNVLSTRLKQMT